MTKKKKIFLGILTVFILIGGGFGMNAIRTHLQRQDDEALMKKVAPEIEEFYQWNYIGVKSTKPIKVWVNPASGERVVDYNVILNNESKKVFSAINGDHDIKVLPLTRQANSSVTFKLDETGRDTPESDDFLLQVKDIERLKKRGYTKAISGEEIKKYLKTTYSKKFQDY